MAVEHAQSNRKGILYLLLAIAAFSSMDAMAKSLISIYPAPQLVFVRFLGQMLAVLLILNRNLPAAIATRYPVLHLFRSASQFGATFFFFLSLSYIGLTEATAIADISPMLITLGAALFLNERLTRARILGVIFSGIGALIVIRPGSDVFTPAAILPLICAFSYAASALLTRFIGPRESPWSSMFYASLFGTVVASAFLPYVWVPIASGDLWRFVVVGVLGTIAQLALIRAFSVGEAAAIAPYSYTGILFASGYSLILFGTLPDALTFLGILVIVGAGLYVWSQEAPHTGARDPD